GRAGGGGGRGGDEADARKRVWWNGFSRGKGGREVLAEGGAWSPSAPPRQSCVCSREAVETAAASNVTMPIRTFVACASAGNMRRRVPATPFGTASWARGLGIEREGFFAAPLFRRAV